MIEALCESFPLSPRIRAAAQSAYDAVRGVTYQAQHAVKAAVLRAFMEEGLAESDLAGSTGYGYDDAAREHYESLLSRIFGSEKTLARLSLVSGTHAIITAVAACVPAGKTLLSITGPPYDTLRNAITQAPHALVQGGVGYKEIALLGTDQPFDWPAIAQALKDRELGAIFVQRSRGYASRRSISIAQCEWIFARIKSVRPDVPILVDNCYGELVESREPTHAGADLIMGSLIKNIGGSLAPAGAYVSGRSDVVERVAARHYAPGLRDALGPTLGFGRTLLHGLFLAPLVVAESLQGLDFAAALFAQLGYMVDPRPGEIRTDIVQAIRLGSVEKINRFAQALQTVLPVNARFRPEPGKVPGYADPVIMSSGAFISGATIELSCDAPLREPYEVYLQGGLRAEHVMLGAIVAAQGLE